MSSDKTIVLITGGNSGVGFALAACLLADASKHVVLGSRSADKGEAAVAELSARKLPGSVELLTLDVADEHSISQAAELVTQRHGRLDVLVNNAAIGWQTGSLAHKMSIAFQTNSLGPLLLAQAFVPLMKKSPNTPRVINISSGAGSFKKRLDNPPDWAFGIDGLPYSTSKASLNLITVALSKIYGEQGIKVFAYSPGFVVSNLGPHNNVENGAKPAEDIVGAIVDVVDGKRDGEHGGFLSAAGQYPW